MRERHEIIFAGGVDMGRVAGGVFGAEGRLGPNNDDKASLKHTLFAIETG